MPSVNTPLTLPAAQLRRLAAGDEPADKYALELLQNMQATDEELRAWTSDALQAVRALPLELAQDVSELCLHDSPAVAAAACGLLAKLGDRATQYQAPIVACLTQHPEITARQQAALALTSISGLTPVTRTALSSAAESPDPRLKRLAQAALEQARARG